MGVTFIDKWRGFSDDSCRAVTAEGDAFADSAHARECRRFTYVTCDETLNRRE